MSERLPKIKHGLYIRSTAGKQLRDQKVARLVNRMRSVMHWLQDSDLPTCRGWAQLEILSTEAYGHLRDKGLLNAETQEPRRLVSARATR